MTPVDSGPYEQALLAFSALLDALPGPSMLVGGVAVIAHGHVRTTDDIDGTVSGERVTPEQIVQLAGAYDIGPRIDDVVTFARRNQVLLLVHTPTRIELDLSLAWLPFEEEALARRTRVRFRDMELQVCHPEDLIVYKIVAARDIDLDDARHLALRHHRTIDRRVAGTLKEFDELLEDGRSRADLWREIERTAWRDD